MKVHILLVVLLGVNLLYHLQHNSSSLSIAGMEDLVSKETILIDNMELYLDALERKAKVIRSNLQRMKPENEKARAEGDAYLLNPLQAFSLLRRMYWDWVRWDVYIQKSVGDEYAEKITNECRSVPSREEFQEAAEAIFRLQDTYGLNPIEMSLGKLNGVQYSARLSAIDCFSIAHYLHGKERYEDATLWFHSAMNLFKENDTNEVLDFDLKTVLSLYAETLAKQDILDQFIPLLDRIISMDPKNAIAILQENLLEMEAKAKKNYPKPTPNITPETRRYQMGCRGEFQQRNPNLYCIYNSTTDPFLKLAPFKMEVVSLDPYMVLYHDVISDYEIETLKNLSKPKLERATVYSERQKKSVPSSIRTGKFAWFPDHTNAVTERINQRLADLTGFDLKRSDQLQVMNYGLGGHYGAHYDFFNVSADTEVVQQTGDRLATALFYLSDVEQGGATIFPNIEIAVYPKKGALILWYNLNSRGEGDANTLHAGCPVLVGSKWICNKWIRERENLFRRPCLR